MIHKMSEHFEKMGLVAKMTSAITLILVIPFAVICFFYYSVYQNSLLDEARNKLEEDLGSLESTMNTNLESMSAVLNGLYYRQEFSYFLDENNELSDDEMNYFIYTVEKELADVRSLYPNLFYQTMIYTSNKQVQEKEHGKDWLMELEALEDSEYYREIEGVDKITSQSFSEVFFGSVREAEFLMHKIARDKLTAQVEQPGTLILPAYLKVYSINTKEMIGCIELNMEVKKLINEADLPSDEGKVDYLLLDSRRTLAYGDEVYQAETFPEEIGAKEKDTIYIDLDSGTYMAAYRRCNQTGIIQVTMMSKAEILAPAAAMIRTVVVLACLGISIIIIFSYWLMRRMLKRLLVLDSMMGEIGMGKFDVTIQESGYNDEISRIEQQFNNMASQLQEVIRTTVEKEKSERDAELRALQAQINPHFLYNTLETMRMQCEIDGYETISESLSVLGELFRYSIKWGNHEVPLEMEWTNLKNYIAIMEMRFDEQLKCIIECEADIEGVMVPKLILQPLVENCFEHAFHQMIPPWLLIIRAYRQDGNLIITIEDNGTGMTPERLEEIRERIKDNKPLKRRSRPGTSIGIINVNQRIQMLCPKGSFMNIESRVEGGTRIVISIVTEEGE